jgi:DNA repair exonuclease SbcCD ATPase subunit
MRTLQYESEIKKVQTEKLRIQEEKSVLESRVYESEKSFNQLKRDLEESSNSKEKATLMLNEQMELVSLEKALKDQADKELENSKGIISQFSRTVSDQEALVQQLNSAVEDLREKNSDLNYKLQDSYTSLEKIRRETNQQITTLELEKQKLALKDATNQEEIARIKLDYSALEKQLLELSHRNQITTVNHLDDVTAHNSKKNDYNYFGDNKSKIAQDSGSGTLGISAPPSKEAPVMRETTTVCGKSIVSDQTKEQRSGVSGAQERRPASASSDCYLCSKQPFGIMRMCQCGSFCGKRAHMSCLIGLSAIFCCDRGDEK